MLSKKTARPKTKNPHLFCRKKRHSIFACTFSGGSKQ